MAKDELRTLLEKIISDTQETLLNPVEAQFNVLSDKKKKDSGLKSLMDKKEKLEKKDEDIREEIRNIEKEIEGIESSNTTSQSDASDNGDHAIYMLVAKFTDRRDYWGMPKTDMDAMREIVKSKEYKNYESFLKLAENTRNLYGLAINKKEKRNIILKFQAKDWRSLGVALPELPHFQDFDIKNGEIVLSTMPALPQPEGEQE